MIVIDSSALIAILRNEPERVAFFEAISAADRRLISAVSYQEAGQVMFARYGDAGLQIFEELLTAIRAEIVPHDASLANLAITAFRTFGKGIHAQARLNFGDCAAYALSRQTGAPLLFKGDDFGATDIVSCVPRTGP